jgi:carboxylate-amine ligase
VCLCLDDSVAVAGLLRGLAWVCAGDGAVGSAPPATEQSVLDAAVWRAARFGLTDELIHPGTGRPEPAATVVQALLDVARPGLEAHGDWEHVSELVDGILIDGTGAERQRAAFRAGGPARIVQQAAEWMLPVSRE